jgi:hypothetical protein
MITAISVGFENQIRVQLIGLQLPMHWRCPSPLGDELPSAYAVKQY